MFLLNFFFFIRSFGKQKFERKQSDGMFLCERLNTRRCRADGFHRDRMRSKAS